MLDGALVNEGAIQLQEPVTREPYSSPAEASPGEQVNDYQTQLDNLMEDTAQAYNRSFEIFVESDMGADDLSLLQSNLNQIQLVSDHPAVPDFYTGNDREADLSVAREASNLITQYRFGLDQLNNLDFQDHTSIQSLPARVPGMVENPLLGFEASALYNQINYAGVRVVQSIDETIESGRAIDQEWLRSVTNSLQILSDHPEVPAFLSEESRDDILGRNSALIDIPEEPIDLSEQPEQPLFPGEIREDQIEEIEPFEFKTPPEVGPEVPATFKPGQDPQPGFPHEFPERFHGVDEDSEQLESQEAPPGEVEFGEELYDEVITPGEIEEFVSENYPEIDFSRLVELEWDYTQEVVEIFEQRGETFYSGISAIFGFGKNNDYEEAAREDGAAWREQHGLSDAQEYQHDALHAFLNRSPSLDDEAYIAGVEHAARGERNQAREFRNRSQRQMYQEGYQFGLERGDQLINLGLIQL